MILHVFLYVGLLFLNVFGNIVKKEFNIKMEDVIDISKKEEETSLSAEDFAKAPLFEVDLSLLGIDVKVDPTMGNKTEGDIAITNIKEYVKSNRIGRSAIRQTYRRWPNGEIPYAISTRYGTYSRSVIAKAMKAYHTQTCVKFVPRKQYQHRDYLYIYPDDGCYSLVGRTGGRQPLSLDVGCIQSGTIIHELMHAVGFFHEQSRGDRDDYIKILWENVLYGAEDQFEKHGSYVLDTLEEPYDYSSIMHYGPYAFSGNGKRTIVARKLGSEKMGQRETFSAIDLRKINKLYECPIKEGENIEDSTMEDMLTTKMTPLKPIEDECRDKHWQCTIWTLPFFDRCDESEIAYVLCPKSCGTCRKKIVVVKPDMTTEEVITVNRGLTTKTVTTTNSTATSTTAPKTSPENQCKDLDSSCTLWASIGDCEDIFQQNTMRMVCPKSCGLCQRVTTLKKALTCDDRASYLTCKLALIFEECDQKANICAKTCGAC